MKDAAYQYITTAEVDRIQEIFMAFTEDAQNRKLFLQHYESWDACAMGELLFDFARDYAETVVHDNGHKYAWREDEDAA